MPRVSKPDSKQGTERYRDEQRADPNPKMHGQQWHDHQGGPVEGLPGRLARSSAVEVVVDTGPMEGMGKSKRGSRGAKRKRLTPVGKGRAGENRR